MPFSVLNFTSDKEAASAHLSLMRFTYLREPNPETGGEDELVIMSTNENTNKSFDTAKTRRRCIVGT